MANDIGLKVGIDGESEFKKALKEINQSMKTLGTEAKLVASQYDTQDKSIEALTARNEVLTKQIAEQAKKVDTLKNALQAAKEKYGENSTQAEQWQQKLNLAQAELNKMNRELGNNEKAIQELAQAEEQGSKAADKYGKANKQAGDEASKGANAFKTVGKVVATVSATMTAAAAAITAAAVKVGKSLIEMTTAGADYADEILTLSQVTGVATSTLQEYSYAAELIDVSVETLTGSMRRNIRSMQSAAKGQAAYLDAYKQLGVAATDANGKLRDGEQVFWELIDALGRVDDETERDALAMQLLGRSAQDLNPLILQGSKRMKELAKEAYNAGYVMSDTTLKQYGKLDDTLEQLKAGATAAKNALGTILMPLLQRLGTEGVKYLGEFSKGIQAANGDVAAMQSVVDTVLPKVLDSITAAIPDIVRIIGDITNALIASLSKNAPKILKALGTIVQSALQTLIEQLPQFSKAVNDGILNIIQVIVERLPDILKTVGQAIKTIIQGIMDALPSIIEAIASILPDLVETIVSLIVEVAKTILKNLPKIIEAILNALDTIIEELLKKLPEIVKTIMTLLPDILKAIVQIVTKIVQKLPELLKMLAEELPRAVGGIIRAVIEGLANFLGDFTKVGKELIEGLISGIVSVFKDIPSLVKSIFSGFVNGIKDFFGIHSPSKMFMGIGKNLGLGLEEGFTDEMKDAQKVFEKAIPTDFDINAHANIRSGRATTPISPAEPQEQLKLLRQQNSLLQAILEKNMVVAIGDEAIGRANARYQQNRGVVLNGGAYVNAY